MACTPEMGLSFYKNLLDLWMVSLVSAQKNINKKEIFKKEFYFFIEISKS